MYTRPLGAAGLVQVVPQEEESVEEIFARFCIEQLREMPETTRFFNGDHDVKLFASKLATIASLTLPGEHEDKLKEGARDLLTKDLGFGTADPKALKEKFRLFQEELISLYNDIATGNPNPDLAEEIERNRDRFLEVVRDLKDTYLNQFIERVG